MSKRDDQPIRRARALVKAGSKLEALEILRTALSEGADTPSELEQAGRMIRRVLADSKVREAISPKPLRVLLLGQCTTAWVATSLIAVAWAAGVALDISEGEYDNVVQHLVTEKNQVADQDLVILLPWHDRLFAPGGHERVDDEVGFWHKAWAAIRGAGSARVIQVGYDWVSLGTPQYAGGPGTGPVELVRAANAALREALPAEHAFVDLSVVSGMFGRDRFYDPRRHLWTRQPFSEGGLGVLARHLNAAVRALTTGPKKVLAVDLDNTLWGGIVGEDGATGVAIGGTPEGEAFAEFQRHLKGLAEGGGVLGGGSVGEEGATGVAIGGTPEGEAFAEFQRHLKGLAERGVVLVVVSKNNPDDARAPFAEHPEMVLALDDFAAFEASWDPKGAALVRIADQLRLGLDSFVFFDDSAFERGEVRHAAPEVTVLDVPDDPAEYVRALEDGLYFASMGVTDADRTRARGYATESKRRTHAESFGSIEDYLRSLELVADIRPIDAADLPRVTQLVGRTNQFNLTTRRHSADEITRMLSREGAVGLSLRLRDRFGDYGLVSVVIGVPDESVDKTLTIDTWLMSCRVIGRTAEHCLFGHLRERARALGYERVVGAYLPTKKNGMVADFYPGLGFAPLGDSATQQMFVLELEDSRAPETFVTVAAAEP